MYPLSSIYLNPTDRCNLRCIHCWLAPPTDEELAVKAGEISLEEIKSAVEQGLPLGLSFVKLTGGEPLLRPDLLDMLKFFHEKSLDVFIETNGTLLTKDLARDMAPYVGGVSVSIDGVDSTHDRLRGKPGCFAQAVSGIKFFMEAGVSTQVIFSLNRLNAGELKDGLKLTRELNVPTFKVNPVLPIGRGETMAKKGMTLEVDEVLDLYRKTKEEAERMSVALFFSVPAAFKPLAEIMSGGFCECSVLNIMGIAGNGDISICGVEKVRQEMVAGNVRRESLKDLWEKAEIFTRLREDVPARMEGICGRCFLKKGCLGSCRALAYYETGSFAAPHYFCRRAEELGFFPRTRSL